MSVLDRLFLYGRIIFDALAYAVVLAGLLTLVAVTLGIASGGGFLRAKLLLFGFGWLVLAYATVKLWPRSPEDMGRSPEQSQGRSLAGLNTSTKLQRFVNRLPPMRWICPPPPAEQVTLEAKMFLAGMFALIVSYLMERWFGIV